MSDGKRRASWPRVALTGALVSAVMLPLGPLGSRAGLWSFAIGFLFLGVALLLSLAGVVTGLVAFTVRRGRLATRDRRPLAAGTVVCAAVLVVLGVRMSGALSTPPIHDISTDVGDPPSFDVAVGLRGAGANPLEYNAALLTPQQQAAYPWVKPLDIEVAPAAAFAAARETLTDLGLDIVNADLAAGRLEAVATTFWFGFKDDVVVRVRQRETGSRVDIRSVSRVGQGDLGANAARIGAILEGITARLRSGPAS